MSCELIVDVDVPFEKEQITLNTFFNPDSVWEAYVTLNRGILSSDTVPYKMVSGALVVIYDGDTPIDTLEDHLFGYYRSDSGKPLAGKSYEVRASAPQYDPVTAKSHCPSLVPITDVRVSETGPDIDGNIPITVKFIDPPLERNFYEITFHSENEYVDLASGTKKNRTTPVYAESDDLNFDENSHVGNSFFLKDVLFNGKEVQFSFKASDGNLLNYSALIVTLNTVSEDYYNYKVTTQLQDNVSGDPFAQPVNVYNNINNGFGIFAGYSRSSLRRENPVPAPVITGFSPKSARVGDRVTVYGKNLGNDFSNYRSQIFFTAYRYGAYASTVSVSDNHIEVIVPSGAITGKIYYMSGRVAISNEVFEVLD